MTTFSAMWTEKLGEAVKLAAERNSGIGYPIECYEGSADFQAIATAVNQGIDSRLEAIAFSEFDGGSRAGAAGRRTAMLNEPLCPCVCW